MIMTWFVTFNTFHETITKKLSRNRTYGILAAVVSSQITEHDLFNQTYLGKRNKQPEQRFLKTVRQMSPFYVRILYIQAQTFILSLIKNHL